MSATRRSISALLHGFVERSFSLRCFIVPNEKENAALVCQVRLVLRESTDTVDVQISF